MLGCPCVTARALITQKRCTEHCALPTLNFESSPRAERALIRQTWTECKWTLIITTNVQHQVKGNGKFHFHNILDDDWESRMFQWPACTVCYAHNVNVLLSEYQC